MAACLGLACTAATAQIPLPVIDPALLNQTRQLTGDSLRLCINGDSALAPLDREVAALLADALLLTPILVELNSAFAIPRYDYRVQIAEPELFVEMTASCDALMGFRLSPTNTPQWLTVSAPYYRTRNVIASLDPSLVSLETVRAKSAPLGARIGAPGDAALRTWLGTTEGASLRIGYPDNEILLQKLTDGTLAAALVWEPALAVAAPEMFAGQEVHVAPTPFDSGNVDFGIAVQSGNAFLRTAFDQAIASLSSSGTLDRLAREQGLPVTASAP